MREDMQGRLRAAGVDSGFVEEDEFEEEDDEDDDELAE